MGRVSNPPALPHYRNAIFSAKALSHKAHAFCITPLFNPSINDGFRLLCSANEVAQAFRLTYYAPRDIFANVIRSFSCKDTQALFEGRCPLCFRSVQRIAERKLAQLDAAQTLEFLRSPPGNHLEKLSGDRRGQWSIRINDQWRVCFVWDENGPCAVEIVDYH